MELIVALVLAVGYFTVTPVRSDVTVELPAAQPEQLLARPQIIVSLDATGTIYLNSDDVTRAELADHLAAIDEGQRKSTRVFVRVHPKLPYERASELMAMIVDAGFEDIALVQGGNGSALEGSMIPSQQ